MEILDSSNQSGAKCPVCNTLLARRMNREPNSGRSFCPNGCWSDGGESVQRGPNIISSSPQGVGVTIVGGKMPRA